MNEACWLSYVMLVMFGSFKKWRALWEVANGQVLSELGQTRWDANSSQFLNECGFSSFLCVLLLSFC